MNRDSPLLEIRRALRTARSDEDGLELIARGLMAYGHGSTEVRSVIDSIRARDARRRAAIDEELRK